MYMRVCLYVLYGTRACGMHKYGMYTVTARDDRRFDTAGLSRSPPPRITAIPTARDDATRNDAQHAGRPDCKTDYPPPNKGIHGSSFHGLLFLLGLINSHILPLPSGPSIARYLRRRSTDSVQTLPLSQPEISDGLQLIGHYVIMDPGYVMTCKRV